MNKPEQLEFFSPLTNDPLCPVCNVTFKKKSSHPNRKYCSDKCWDKQYRIKNKEKIRERDRKYHKLRYQGEYIKKSSERHKQYRIKNKEKMREREKQYRIKNKEKIKEIKKKYFIKNKEKIKEQNKQALKRHYIKNKNNVNYKLRINLRKRIGAALVKRKTIKSENTLGLLGCSWDRARKHLESQFKKGMTWDNYGYKGWHIDHIIPCSSFDLTNIEEQKKCFNYKNLQPLWWHENLSKGSKII